MAATGVWGPLSEPPGPQRVTAVAPANLNRAVDALAATPHVESLNIRAGEHIAGLLLTAFNGPPSSVDVHGEVDFLFRRHSADWPWLFGDGDVAAVEVKSSPGAYRHLESKMALGDEFQVHVRSVSDLLADTSQVVLKAVAALDRKASPGASRHVFLLMHPFDGVPPEPFDGMGLIANQLPTVDPGLRLDTIWVLFHSWSALAMWSSQDQQWSNLIVAGWNPDDGPEPDGIISDVHDAEAEFLTRVGLTGGSPWLFGVQSVTVEPDDGSGPSDAQ